MKVLEAAVILILASALADAVTYDPLAEAWSIDLGGDLLEVRDVEGNGSLEITVGLFSEQGSYAYLLDNNGVLIWRNKISVIWPQNSPNALVVDDVDGNGYTEIVVGSVVEAKTCSFGMSPYASPVFVLERNPNLQNNQLKWVHRDYGYSVSLDAADLGGDDSLEIISGTRDGAVYALNSDGTLRWKYTAEGTVGAVHASDLNRDGVPEIIAGSFNYVHALKNTGARMWRYNPGDTVVAVYGEDINRDGLKEVLAVSEDDQVTALSAAGKLMWNTTVRVVKPTVTAGDLDGDNTPEVFVAAADTVYALDHMGRLKWTHEVGYPIVELAAADLWEGETNLIVLGARKITAYRINQDYLRDLTADDNLQKALAHYASGNFSKARNHALAAQEIYAELNDTEQVRKARELSNTSVKYVQADKLMVQARRNYTAGDYPATRELAAEAHLIYLSLDDTVNAAAATDLVDDAIDQITAQGYYQQALEYNRAEDYVEGSIYALKALEMYRTLEDEANILKAEKLVNNTVEYRSANNNYDQALRLYQQENYEAAKEHATSAKQSYAIVGDSGRITAADTLLSRIEEQLEIQARLATAASHYGRALTAYEEGNYHGCVDQATQALGIYADLGETGNQATAATLLSTCNTGVEAQQNYATAFEHLTAQQYELAKDYAAKARQLYRTIEDHDNAIKSGNLILEAEEEQRKTQGVDISTLILPLAAAATLLILAAAAYLIYSRLRKKKPKKELEVDYTPLIPEEPAKDEEEPEPQEKEPEPEEKEEQQPPKPEEQPPKPEHPQEEESPLLQILSEIPESEEEAEKAAENKPPAEKPETKQEQTPEPESREDISKRLDALLAKGGTKPTEKEEPEKPAQQPQTEEKPAEEPEKTPEQEKPPETLKPEEPPEEPEEDARELDAAEKIKKELEAINKKLGK